MRKLAAAVGVAVAAIACAAASSAVAGPRASFHPHPCGLLRASRDWAEDEHIHGHFYAYSVFHIGCKSNQFLALRIAVLTIDGASLPNSTEFRGFKCRLGDIRSGYCYKGNLRKSATLVFVEWAPEEDCADPNPPFTPYDTLPAKCHS